LSDSHHAALPVAAVPRDEGTRHPRRLHRTDRPAVPREPLRRVAPAGRRRTLARRLQGTGAGGAGRGGAALDAGGDGQSRRTDGFRGVQGGVSATVRVWGGGGRL